MIADGRAWYEKEVRSLPWFRLVVVVIAFAVVVACADRTGGDVPPPRPQDAGMASDAASDRDAFVPPPDAAECDDEQC